MRISQNALRHARAPGSGRGTDPNPRAARSGYSVVGNGTKLTDCCCPLSGSPHTRNEHARAELRRDLPGLFAEGSRG